MAKTNRAVKHELQTPVDAFDYDQNDIVGSLDKAETAAYISDVVLQLRNMAKRADMKFLVYFLEMAFQEAFTQSTKAADSSKR